MSVSCHSAEPLDRAATDALRRALASFCKSHRALPFSELVRFSGAMNRAELAVDIDSASSLGVPVVVLRPAAGGDGLGKLSRREREVALLVADGARNPQIARQLGISLATVKDHVHRILQKTGHRSRTQLAVAVIRGAL